MPAEAHRRVLQPRGMAWGEEVGWGQLRAFLPGLGCCLQPSRCLAYLLPSWKRANSRVARSSTVSDVTVTGPLALLGNMPCTRTSCQSEWSLQISTESKYLWGSWAQHQGGPLRVRCSASCPSRLQLTQPGAAGTRMSPASPWGCPALQRDWEGSYSSRDPLMPATLWLLGLCLP